MTGPIRFAVAAALLAVAAPASAKTLVFCSEADPGVLDPHTVTSFTDVNAAEPMFEGLVRLQSPGGAIEPGLARSWDVSPDGTEYTFHLRPGVRFHSGARFAPTRTLDADDVLFSFNRQWRADNPYHGPGVSFDYFDDLGMAQLLAAVERVDDLTVRFRLTRPEAPFLADLTMPFAKVLSAEYADAMLKAGTPERFAAEPVGTGPFSFEAYRKGVTVRYRAFDGYWGGRRPIDTLVFSITPDASIRMTKLKAGECQVASFPNAADAAAIEVDPHLSLLRQEGFNVGFLAMNVGRPPFDDPRVRRAVNMAIDKDTLVRAVYGRGGVPAKNPLPPTIWAYDERVPPYPYDPAAARRLMSEAGLDRGVDVDLWYMPVARAYNPDGRRAAEMVADDLARIGVRAHLVTAPWAAYRTAVMAGDPALSFFGWTSDNGDPDNFLSILLGCRDGHPFAYNVAKWCDARYDALVEAAKLTTDRDRRADLYRQAQAVVHDAAPWVPIAHGVVLSAVRKSVRGFRLDPFGRFLFDQVDVGAE